MTNIAARFSSVIWVLIVVIIALFFALTFVLLRPSANSSTSSVPVEFDSEDRGSTGDPLATDARSFLVEQSAQRYPQAARILLRQVDYDTITAARQEYSAYEEVPEDYVSPSLNPECEAVYYFVRDVYIDETRSFLEPTAVWRQQGEDGWRTVEIDWRDNWSSSIEALK